MKLFVTDLFNSIYLFFAYVFYRLRIINNITFGTVIKQYLLILGPLGIKIGQLLSHRIDFIPEDICNLLSELTNNVSSDCSDVEYIIDKEILQGFTNCKLIGGGCVANSYLGEHDGKQYVIKIKRLNIERIILDSVLRIRNLIRVVNLFRIFALGEEMMSKLERIFNILIRQSDFKREINELNYFYLKYEMSDTIIVPKPYFHLSSNDRIVMDYLQGRDMSELSEIEKKNHALELWKFSYESAFMDGHWHSDLHKGNLVFLNNKLGIIDYGITGKFTTLERTIILNYTTFIVKKQFYSAARVYVLRMTKINNIKNIKRFDKSLFVQDVCEILKEYFNTKDNLPDIFGSVKALAVVSRKYGTVFNDRFVEFELAFSTLLNVLVELGGRTIYEYFENTCGDYISE